MAGNETVSVGSILSFLLTPLMTKAQIAEAEKRLTRAARNGVYPGQNQVKF